MSVFTHVVLSLLIIVARFTIRKEYYLTLVCNNNMNRNVTKKDMNRNI